jgi:hypothetical protein
VGVPFPFSFTCLLLSCCWAWLSGSGIWCETDRFGVGKGREGIKEEVWIVEGKWMWKKEMGMKEWKNM